MNGSQVSLLACYRVGALKKNSLEPLEDSCRLRLSAAI